MKKVLVIVLLALSSLVVYSQRKVDKDFAQLKWLVGDWVEKSDRPGETHTESLRLPHLAMTCIWIFSSNGNLDSDAFVIQL